MDRVETLTFRPRTIPTYATLCRLSCPSRGRGYGNWNKAPGSGRDPHPSPWTIPTQAPVALLPREGTTGTGQEQLDGVIDARHLPGPYPGRLPLPFSRGRVQRELGQGSRIGSRPSPFPLDHTHRGSRCPSPEGGYNRNWQEQLDHVLDPPPLPQPYLRRLPVLLPREGTTRTGTGGYLDRVETLTFRPRTIPTVQALVPRERGQGELAQGSRIGSRPSPFPLDHTHAGSRCPSPEGGYNGNWTRVLDRVD